MDNPHFAGHLNRSAPPPGRTFGPGGSVDLLFGVIQPHVVLAQDAFDFFEVVPQGGSGA